jgi:hypothetical protein
VILSNALIAVLAVVALLGVSALTVLVLLIVSIHRTSHAPLSQLCGQRSGSISRRMLTGTRTPACRSTERK